MGKITDIVREDVRPLKWPAFGKESDCVVCEYDVRPKENVQIEAHSITIDLHLSVDDLSPLPSLDYESV